MGKKYYIILGVLAVVFILVNISTPRKINWTQTFQKKHTYPYGAEVTYQLLENIYGQGNIEYNKRSPYDYLHNNLNELNVIYVADTIHPADTDMEAILEHAARGNHIFIAAHLLNGDFADSLGITSKANFPGFYATEPDSVSLSFTRKELDPKQYWFKPENVRNYVEVDSNKQMTVVSASSNNRIHFIKIPYGKGYIYYHSNPLLFTNYSILFQQDQYAYMSTCLSYLPKRKTLWSEFYSAGGSQERKTELRFILNNTQLRWAYFILFTSIGIFLVFQGKRKQRPIPVIEPPKNSTLEFVHTTGRLYFQQRNHLNLARKKIIYFLEKIRNKYYINTRVLNEEFIESLSSKSGVPAEEIRQLVHDFEKIKQSNELSELALQHLNKKIESFYKKASL